MRYVPGTVVDGVHVIGVREVSGGHVMLARTVTDHVTWVLAEDGARFSGHYFPRARKGSFPEAWADYCSRS